MIMLFTGTDSLARLLIAEALISRKTGRPLPIEPSGASTPPKTAAHDDDHIPANEVEPIHV